MSQTKVAIGMVDATGTPGSGNFLRGDGSWNAPSGGGWEFVSESVASSSATIAFTGFETGYDYQVVAYNVLPATDNQHCHGELGVTGPSYRTSNYLGSSTGVHNGGATTGVESTSGLPVTWNPQGNQSDEQLIFNLEIYDPVPAAPTFTHGTCKMQNSGSEMGGGWVGGWHTASDAIVAIQFKYASGNISTGTFQLYKRVNA